MLHYQIYSQAGEGENGSGGVVSWGATVGGAGLGAFRHHEIFT